MIWVLIIACVIVLFGVLFVDNEEQEYLFSFLVALLASLFFSLGVLTVYELGIKSDKPLTPSVEVECTDGKCDTTYIYKKSNQ